MKLQSSNFLKHKPKIINKILANQIHQNIKRKPANPSYLGDRDQEDGSSR
jgi:hypothetical protein